MEKGQSFEVSTPAGLVRVLGTSFNVKQRQQRMQVACYTGKVQVLTKADSTLLIPGQSVVSNKDTLLDIGISEGEAPDWLDGILRFDRVPLPEVVQQLEQQFDISIQLQSGEDRLYKGYFKTNDLDAALKSVFDPMDLNYSEVAPRLML